MELTQDSCDVVDYPDSISSGGLGPCVAIGIMHNRRAYMIHVTFLQHAMEEDECGFKFFSLIQSSVPPEQRKRVKAFVVGASLENPRAKVPSEEDELTLASREAAMSELRKLGFLKITTKWCPLHSTAVLEMHTWDQTAVIRVWKHGPSQGDPDFEKEFKLMSAQERCDGFC